MPTPLPTPSVDRVVDALSRSTPPLVLTAQLSKAHPITVMLSLLCVLLVGVWLGLTWHLVRQTEAMVAAIHQQRAEQRKVPEIVLPTPDQLLNAQAFTEALDKKPDQAGLLYAAQGRAWLERADAAAAAQSFTRAARLSPHGLTTSDQLLWVAALTKSGAAQQAMSCLKAVDVTKLSDSQQRQLVALTVELYGQLRDRTEDSANPSNPHPQAP